jgi:ATP-dependent DNA helicase RecG
MQLAVEEMLKSRSEHKDKHDPLVGAVLVSKDGELLGSAHRGGLRVGNHAEFTLIERCLADSDLEGSTLYVTLEPCTQRNSPKTPCAEWIAKARIGRVVIGIPDPNPDILGRGIRYLQKQDIQLDFFDREFVRQITDANRDFIDYCESTEPALLAAEPPEGSSNKELEPQIGVHLQSFAAPALQQYLARRGMADLPIPSDDLWNYLEQCRYITRTEEGGRWPTLAGVVLFASNAADILPQARISIESKIGNDASTLEFTGPLVAFRDTFEKFLQREVRLLTRYEGLDRRKVPQYPILAVREAAFNAIAHRDYIGGARVHITMSDSAVIIRSPGAPLRPLSIARLRRFDAPPYSRNPHIAMAMHHLGLMEEKGSGLTRMRGAMLDHDLPEPTFSFDDGYVVVTLSGRRQESHATPVASNRVSQLSEAERRVLEVVAMRQPLGTKECAAVLKLDTRTVRRHLQELVAKGVLKQEGSGPKIVYRVAVDRLV